MSISESQLIWIACLSKRGGGVHLLQETEQILVKSGFSIISIVSIEKNSSLANCKVLPTPSLSFIKLFNFFTFPFASFAFFYRSRKRLPVAFIQIMPSPMDYWLDIWCRIFGVRIYRAIHDFQPHPGEVWPTKKAIQRRISIAAEVFVFSAFVLENLHPISDKRIHKCSLPVEINLVGNISPGLRNLVLDLKYPLVLFIGRIRKYKGLEFFLEATSDHSNSDFSFLIAGSGSINLRARMNVFLWNEWLTEVEIDFLLNEADVVVFPYLEASQSGVIPLAMKKNKVILASKVGSLAEQLNGYERKVLVDAGISKSLIDGLDAAIHLSSNQHSLKNSPTIDHLNPFGEVITSVLRKNK